MKRRANGLALRAAAALLLAVALTACGGGGFDSDAPGGSGGGTIGGGGGGGPGGGQTATLVLFAEDQASGNVHSFAMTLTGITLSSSTSDESLLPAAVALEWTSRSLAPTVLSTTQVPAATYTQLEVLVSSPEMVVFNPTAIPPGFETFSPTLTTSSVQIATNLTLNAGDVVGLRLDLDLLNSVSSTTEVTPQFDLVLTSFQTGELPGDIDDALGTINSVDTNSFTMTLTATGQQLILDVDTGTIFDGVASTLADLSLRQRVEVDARLQQSGHYRALVVEVDSLAPTDFLRGLVVAVNRDILNNATNLTLLVLEENPDQLGIDAGDQRSFTVDANTGFRINREDLSVLGFTFDRQELRLGQVVVIEPDSAQANRAAQLVLKQGTIPGLVTSVGQVTFTFSPLASFFADSGFPSVLSVTETNTEFEDLPAGLASLQRDQTVAVRGLFLFEFSQPRLVTKRLRLLAPPP
ncbi:MAG: DUF5666 domain-containing protein [Terriglobia bacterium]